MVSHNSLKVLLLPSDPDTQKSKKKAICLSEFSKAIAIKSTYK